MHNDNNTFREDNATSEEINIAFISVFSVVKPGGVPMLEYFWGLGSGD